MKRLSCYQCKFFDQHRCHRYPPSVCLEHTFPVVSKMNGVENLVPAPVMIYHR